MTNDYVFFTKTLMIGVKLMRGNKKTLKEKVKVSAKISKCHKRIHIFSCTAMIAKHLTWALILTFW